MPTKVIRPMNVRIPDAVHAWLKAEARSQDRSVNYVLCRILEEAQKRSQSQTVPQ